MSSTGDSGGTKSSFDPVVKVDSYSPCPLVVSERSGAPNFHVSELRKLCVYVCGVGGGCIYVHVHESDIIKDKGTSGHYLHHLQFFFCSV